MYQRQLESSPLVLSCIAGAEPQAKWKPCTTPQIQLVFYNPGYCADDGYYIPIASSQKSGRGFIVG